MTDQYRVFLEYFVPLLKSLGGGTFCCWLWDNKALKYQNDMEDGNLVSEQAGKLTEKKGWG